MTTATDPGPTRQRLIEVAIELFGKHSVAGTSLQRIPQALALARRTRRIMRQNLAWAIGYNLLALPLSASGAITPWIAALGMAGSSLLVTTNALRLVRVPAVPASIDEVGAPQPQATQARAGLAQ